MKTPRDEAIEAMSDAANSLLGSGNYKDRSMDALMSAALDALLDHLSEPGDEMTEAGARQLWLMNQDWEAQDSFDAQPEYGKDYRRDQARLVLPSMLNTLRDKG